MIQCRIHRSMNVWLHTNYSEQDLIHDPIDVHRELYRTVESERQLKSTRNSLRYQVRCIPR